LTRGAEEAHRKVVGKKLEKKDGGQSGTKQGKDTDKRRGIE